MRKGNNRVCGICSKVIKPGGMGGHMRLAHGISVKTIVKLVYDIRGDARDVPADVRDARVQHANDFELKHSVVEARIDHSNDRSKSEIPYSQGKVLCAGGQGCGEWYYPEELTDGLCCNCIHNN